MLAQCQTFVFSPLYPPASRMGMGKELGGNMAKKADVNWLKGYSIPATLCSAIKNGDRGRSGEGEEGGCLSRWPMLRD